MKVLIVDDEPRVLSALNRVLRQSAPSDWEVSTATSGSEALAKLGDAAVDVVVSDMRMPEMDGTTLLREIRARWPGTVRMVLSGHADPEEAHQVASIAHQFFEKPLSIKDLVAALRDVAQLRRGPITGALRDVLGAIGDLPAPPTIYTALATAAADPRAHIDQLTAIVQRDPALVAKVLQLAGSAFFTLRTPTSDLRTAIGRLGIRLVSALALSASAFRPDPISGLSLDALSNHAIACAATARRRVQDPEHAEDAFVAGLLADIGLAALACWLPLRVRDARALAQHQGAGLADAERALYGVTHAEVGGYVLGLWHLPSTIVEAVELHHTLDPAILANRPVALAVYQAHVEHDRELTAPEAVPAEPAA
ncbi:MAG: HDOD domain-containing protein [Deltaproteobacteria bacterium]|nr:HDOD domain-containing protein [Deltaproteobacteria bacterium]